VYVCVDVSKMPSETTGNIPNAGYGSFAFFRLSLLPPNETERVKAEVLGRTRVPPQLACELGLSSAASLVDHHVDYKYDVTEIPGPVPGYDYKYSNDNRHVYHRTNEKRENFVTVRREGPDDEIGIDSDEIRLPPSLPPRLPHVQFSSKIVSSQSRPVRKPTYPTPVVAIAAPPKPLWNPDYRGKIPIHPGQPARATGSPYNAPSQIPRLAPASPRCDVPALLEERARVETSAERAERKHYDRMKNLREKPRQSRWGGRAMGRGWSSSLLAGALGGIALGITLLL
jgi:hypothetical protein